MNLHSTSRKIRAKESKMDKDTKTQLVKISLSNGRTGVFKGPFIIEPKELEKGEIVVTDLYFSDVQEK